MTYLLLFYEFFKTGLFAVGGGLATLPFIYDIAVRYPEWINMNDISNMIAVSESTPGPMGVNMATFTGFTTAGVFGALSATIGLVVPSVIIIIIIAHYLGKPNRSRYILWTTSGSSRSNSSCRIPGYKSHNSHFGFIQ